MKKLLLFVLAAIGFTFGFAQTTATNFTANDCASNSHTLFTELDAGKVIVLCWVMPCGSCINPASTDATTVQGYASSNPGKVKFYVSDDSGNSTCSTVNNWLSTNSITADAVFGNSGNVIKMTDYGSSGMPKTVVLGGTSHTVFYNVNGAVTVSGLQTAINNALNTVGITEISPAISSAHVFPNPAADVSSVSYSLESAADVDVSIYNIIGNKVGAVFTGNHNAGEHKLSIDCSRLDNGTYFVKIIAGKTEKTIILSVAH